MIRAWFLAVFALISIAALADEGPGYSWKHCERADLGGLTIPFDWYETFKPECAPDTVYSWQFPERVGLLAPKEGDRNAIRFDFLYTWRTPVETVEFGDTQIRLKLKPDARFVLVDETRESRNCRSDEKNTIHVGYRYAVEGSIRSEYILCDPAVVESWSIDTKEAFAELERERAWILAHGESDYDRFERPNSIRSLLGTSIIGDLFSKIRQRSGDGRIFYAPGVPEDRARHFSTKLPSYFNPND